MDNYLRLVKQVVIVTDSKFSSFKILLLSTKIILFDVAHFSKKRKWFQECLQFKIIFFFVADIKAIKEIICKFTKLAVYAASERPYFLRALLTEWLKTYVANLTFILE